MAITKIRDYATKMGASVGWDGKNVLLNGKAFTSPNFKIQNGVSYADEAEINSFLKPQYQQIGPAPVKGAYTPDTQNLTTVATNRADLQVNPVIQQIMRALESQQSALDTQAQSVAPVFDSAIQQAGVAKDEALKQVLQAMADNNTVINSGIKGQADSVVARDYVNNVTDLQGAKARELQAIAAQKALLNRQTQEQLGQIEAQRGMLVTDFLDKLTKEDRAQFDQDFADQLAGFQASIPAIVASNELAQRDFTTMLQNMQEANRLEAEGNWRGAENARLVARDAWEKVISEGQLKLNQDKLELDRELGWGQINASKANAANANSLEREKWEYLLKDQAKKEKWEADVTNFVNTNFPKYRRSEDLVAELQRNSANITKALGVPGYQYVLEQANGLGDEWEGTAWRDYHDATSYGGFFDKLKGGGYNLPALPQALQPPIGGKSPLDAFLEMLNKIPMVQRPVPAVTTPDNARKR